MSTRTLGIVALAACAALSLAACGRSAGQTATATSAYDTSKPVPGSSDGKPDATPAEVKAALAQDPWWYPSLFVDCTAPATDAKGCNGAPTAGVYNAIPKALATKKHQICAVLPHVKDPYWVAMDYGTVTEAKRLGVTLDVYEAGGYTELSKQLNQIDDCVAAGAKAIIIGAISFDGLDAKVAELRGQGIYVIDGLNGISSDKVSARAVLAWHEMGTAAGSYLKERGGTDKVAWFPGPAGAGWAEDATKGIQDILKGTGATIVATKYGDTDKNVQLRLVEDTLQASKDVTVIAGTAVTAEAAAASPLSAGKTILADYLIPSTFDLVKSGKVTCAISDQPVIQARMAVDMAVRLLEGIPLDDGRQRAFPAPIRVCGPAAGTAQNLADFIPETTFAPAGFSPVFHVAG
ncbi:MAG: reductase system periplasmic protein TorT [Frankiales bacterium]|jgi:protein TorT|nr:reductase system periplasmic protein TorT [Frankiales bacterium]